MTHLGKIVLPLPLWEEFANLGNANCLLQLANTELKFGSFYPVERAKIFLLPYIFLLT